MAALPLSVIGGYLGAGKTTLINQLLAVAAGVRLGVLVNDFGAINVDAQLVAAHSGTTLALTNGCVCCRVDDSLGTALETLLAVRPRLDHVLVEASGVADPERTLALARNWPRMRAARALVVVDGNDVRRCSADKFVGRHVLRQLGMADLLVVSKLQRPDAALLAWLGTHSAAPVVPAGAELLAALRQRGQHGPGGHVNPDVPADRTLQPHPEFEARSIEVVGRPTLVQLRRWLTELPPACVRVKGLVASADGLMLVQRAAQQCTVVPAPAHASPGPVVVIVPRAARLGPLAAP